MGITEVSKMVTPTDRIRKEIYMKCLKKAYAETMKAIEYMEKLMGTGNSEEEYCDSTGKVYWREMCRLIKVKNLLKEHIYEECKEHIYEEWGIR